MKYEFHVGDYVETKDGDIGIITKVNPDDSSCWYVNAYWYCTYSRDSRTKNQTYVIPDETNADMADFFNRIGQYDFTKKDNDKDESKIEPLVKSHLLENADGKDEWYFDFREVIEKINELVEAVNELKTDYEKHLRAHELTER